MGECLELNSNARGDFACIPQGGVWNMGIFSFNTQNALLQDALKNPTLKKPSDLQKSVQSGRVEADPDVGLLTMASFPPLV